MRPSPRHFHRVQLHRNMRHYRFVLDVCEFVHRQALPAQEAGTSRFRDFVRDEACMGALFEQFVRNFYAKEQDIYVVSAPQIDWHVDPRLSTEGGLDLLPVMKTDICMEAADDRLIIDCKFYADAFQRHFDRRRFVSGNLYQMLAYLRSQARQPGWAAVRGMLLYPTVDHRFDETVHLEGHSIRLVSIDLNQHWENISDDLLQLLRAPDRSNSPSVELIQPDPSGSGR